MVTIEDRITEVENRGKWIPACGGQEVPFTVNRTRVLYCWHTGTKQHAYLNVDTDIIMTDAEFEALRN